MKKLLITLSLIFLFFIPSVFAEMVPDIPAGTAEDYYNRGNQHGAGQPRSGDCRLRQSDHGIQNIVAYYNRANAYSKQGKPG